LNQGPRFVSNKKQNVYLPPLINRGGFQTLKNKKLRWKVGKKISPLVFYCAIVASPFSLHRVYSHHHLIHVVTNNDLTPLQPLFTSNNNSHYHHQFLLLPFHRRFLLLQQLTLAINSSPNATTSLMLASPTRPTRHSLQHQVTFFFPSSPFVAVACKIQSAYNDKFN